MERPRLKDFEKPKGKNVPNITFLGTGDAFGHGGRLQPCILVETPSCRFLMDCGATATLAMHRYGIDPNHIELILISHLHGDHFGGIPYFILDAQLHSKRRSPLTIAGPEGTGARLKDAMEVLFPGSLQYQAKIFPGSGGTPTGHPLVPSRSDGPFIESDSCQRQSGPGFPHRRGLQKTIAYTGDTEWFDGLIPILKNADLLIAESYFYEKPIKFHLNYRTLMDYLPLLKPGKLLLTHMSRDMLDRLDEIDAEAAHDGLEIRI